MDLFLVTYDVSTPNREGHSRLRRVAKLCEGYGQRVQYSVFECRMTKRTYEEFVGRLLDIIDLDIDSLRIYRIVKPTDQYVEIHGVDRSVDFTEPLVF